MATSLNNKYASKERYRAVIEHGNGMLVVSAGPGTGKTYSLLRKIENLLNKDIDSSQIYYLTFANSIVEAFKSDVAKPKKEGGLGKSTGDLGIPILTLHSLALKIVKVYSNKLRLSSHLEIIDLSPKPQSKLSQMFIEDLFVYSKSAGLIVKKRDFNVLLKQLSETWRKNNQLSGDCKKLEGIVDKFCYRYSILSWDQLVRLAIKAISEDGLPKWLQGAQHFLIDEYQDFNPAEQRLIKLITEPCDSVIIVGDPDQSIYSGRSASPQGLTNLLTQNDVQYVNFVFCRRCPIKVITAANNMLKFMNTAEGYAKKKLKPFKNEDGNFVINPFKSCKDEVKKIANFLKTLSVSKKSDTIILLPKKAIDYYVNKFKESGIDCNVRTADLSQEMLLAMLRLVILPNQPFLYRVLLSYFSNLENKYRKYVLPIYIEGDMAFVDSLMQISKNQKWQQRFKDSLTAFVGASEKITSMNTNSVIQGLADVKITINESVITNLLDSDDYLSARERTNNSLSLIEIGPDDSTENVGQIEVMTMHSSKGLSKQFVIIPAFDEKILPGENTGERLDEMHRLVYVAITRAKNQVIITFPKTRARGDPLNYGVKPKISSYADILLPSLNR